LPAEIITNTLSDTATPTWTVPAGVNSVTIEASSSGALGTSAIATSTSGVYQGGGGSGQVGNITIPVAEGTVLNMFIGRVTAPGSTIPYSTLVEINGTDVTTRNEVGNTSRMDGGNGATLNAAVFCSYSCGGGSGMNSSCGGASGTSGSGSTCSFNGTALAEWGSGNSGNSGLNNGAPPLVLPDIGTQPSGAPGTGGGVLGGVFLNADCRLGCGGCDGGSGSPIPPGSGGGGYVKLRLY